MHVVCMSPLRNLEPHSRPNYTISQRIFDQVRVTLSTKRLHHLVFVKPDSSARHPQPFRNLARIFAFREKLEYFTLPWAKAVCFWYGLYMFQT